MPCVFEYLICMMVGEIPLIETELKLPYISFAGVTS
jgi:hypothetical protein